MAVQLWDGIDNYVALVALVVSVGLHLLLSALFPSNSASQQSSQLEEAAPPPPPPAFRLGPTTLEKLSAYDGSDPTKPCLVAIMGDIYDVSKSWQFSSPTGRYNCCLGREAGRALARASFREKDFSATEDKDIFETHSVGWWKRMFMRDFIKVGTIWNAAGPAKEECMRCRLLLQQQGKSS